MLHSSVELPPTVEMALPEAAYPVAASKSSSPCSPDRAQTLNVGALLVGAGDGGGVCGTGVGLGVVQPSQVSGQRRASSATPQLRWL